MFVQTADMPGLSSVRHRGLRARWYLFLGGSSSVIMLNLINA